MKSSKLILLVLVSAVLLASLTVYAGTGARRGTAGAAEILIPVGARGTALNGSFTSGISGLEALHWNPAGLAQSQNTAEAMFSHQDWLADMAIEYLAVSAKLGDFGNLAFSIRSFDFGAEIVETTIENPDGTGRTFAPDFLTFGLSYARTLTDRVTFGATLKVISETILDASATGMAADIGLQYSTGVGGLRLGFVIKNLGTRMQFDGTSLEQRVQIPGTEAGARQENLAIKTASFELPSTLEIGASYDVNMGENNGLTVMGAFHNNSFSYDTFNLGAEYSFEDLLFLRGSYSIAQRVGLEDFGKSDGFASSDEDYLFGPGLGAGIKLDISETSSLALDYAYKSVSVFSGGTQWFSISVGF